MLILSMHADRRFVLEALRAGASGYYLKDSSGQGARGRYPQHRGRRAPALREYLCERRAGVHRLDARRDVTAYSVLSDRERQVLQLLAEGLATKEVAARLHISVKTAESHRARIMAKLDLHSIAELTKYAVREG